MTASAKRARAALTAAQQSAVDAYWTATTPAEEREALARMLWLGIPLSCDPPNPPGWATLENVR